MTSYISQTGGTLDYTTTYPDSTYSQATKSTIDMIGEEFIKKEGSPGIGGLTSSASPSSRPSSASLPSLTYTTTTIPTISTGDQHQTATSQQEAGVLYYNLDDLSRYMPDNFNFDMSDTTSGMTGGELPGMEALAPSKSMTISIPGEKGGVSQSFTVQLKSNNTGMLTIPTIDTTKLTGQLSVVQELPEVSRLVFQEVKQDDDSIVNILETMKEEDPASLSPLDYTVHSPAEETPLNLVNPAANKGIKRVMTSSSSSGGVVTSMHPDSSSTSLAHHSHHQHHQLVPAGATTSTHLVDNLPHSTTSTLVESLGGGAKRFKNVVVVQDTGNGEQIVHELMGGAGGVVTTTTPVSSEFGNALSAVDGSQRHVSMSPSDTSVDMDATISQIYTASTTTTSPLSPKSENKSKNAALMKTFPTKTVAGTVIPSSKTCNWVFENGQVCGKTFSKSYNLVVHMRMHEDIRPFACTLCDQTFRQKAHLQRHETTHGIHTKSFYRNPPKGGSRRRKRGGGGRQGGARGEVEQNTGRKKEDSEGEMMEDEEDDMYVNLNGNPAKRVCPLKAAGRSYPSPDCEDKEADSDTGMYDLGKDGGGDGTQPAHDGSMIDPTDKDKCEQVITAGGGLVPGVSLVQQDDDDTSTVQDILHTVNSVPTLEQNIKYLQTAQSIPVGRLGRGKVHQISKLMDTATISNLSLSNNNLPGLTATLSQNLPGSNILYTTISGSPMSAGGGGKVVIENLDDHSPEIQAELLNALLADEHYQADYEDQEEIYRLNTLPSNWWVSRRRRGPEGLISEVTYYSPQGLAFKSKEEIQNFLQNNIINRDTRAAGLRHPPIPVTDLPILEDTLQQPPPSLKISSLAPSSVQVTGSQQQQQLAPGPGLDANSIAQALIANLKPEPLESLMAESAAKPLQDISVSSPVIPHTLAAPN